MRSAPMARGGFAPSAAFRGAARPFSARGYAVPPRFAPPALRPVTAAPASAPAFYQRNRGYPSTRRVRGLNIAAYPVGIVGFLPYGGFYDDSYDDLSAPAGPTALQQPDYGYADSPYPDYGAEYAAYPQPEAQPATIAEVPSTPAAADTVTLVFNNGRPPEQIQNYLATRTTLTVIDGTRRRDIPVAELDLAATVKANRDAGIDFQLPE